MAALTEALGEELLSGQVAVVLAPPGVGKTAVLVHAALAAMLEGRRVLHVAVSDSVEHVCAQYDQVISALEVPAAERVGIERHRMIHSYLDKGFVVEQLRHHLKILSEVAQFSPELVVVDGLDDETARTSIADLESLAGELGAPLWMSMRLIGDGIPDEVRRSGTVGVRLTPDGGVVKLSVLRKGEETDIELVLTANAALISAHRAGAVDPVQIDPSKVQFYSGGARGSEACFGALAAKYGLIEQNFSFPGHRQERVDGRYELSPRELAAGDVSLVYVSRRLNRTYSTEGTLIRKVLQTLWHMVSRSQKVLVVGAIQEDGTVVGGTGWSVELARMWNKDLWVYDQVQRGWFHWDGHRWQAGETTLDSLHICGTGTRYLEPHGVEALEQLFARSFE